MEKLQPQTIDAGSFLWAIKMVQQELYFDTIVLENLQIPNLGETHFLKSLNISHYRKQFLRSSVTFFHFACETYYNIERNYYEPIVCERTQIMRSQYKQLYKLSYQISHINRHKPCSKDIRCTTGAEESSETQIYLSRQLLFILVILTKQGEFM